MNRRQPRFSRFVQRQRSHDRRTREDLPPGHAVIFEQITAGITEVHDPAAILKNAPDLWSAVVISRRVILEDRHPLFRTRLAGRFWGRDFGLLAKACACQCDRHDRQALKTETQTCTSDQRILPGVAKWTSCRNASVENGGCGLSLTRWNLAAQGKTGWFQRVTYGVIRDLLDSPMEKFPGTPASYIKGQSTSVLRSARSVGAAQPR